MPLFKRKSHEPTNSTQTAEVSRWHFETVEEINYEFLRQMARTWDTTEGKFVRIGGDLVLIAAIRNDPNSRLLHRDILEYGLRTKDTDFKQRIVGAQAVAAASRGKLLDRSGIKDAGSFFLEARPDGEVAALVVEGESTAYGSADSSGREHTVEVVRQKLGTQTKVINGDLEIPK